MTTKFVGASGKNGREREVIPVPDGMTDVKAVMVFFQCDRHTAKASIERGYYIVDFHQRTVYPGPLDTESAYKLAWFIYRRKFESWLPWYVGVEDLVQEGVTRLFEMAGHPRFQEKGFQFYLALNAMKGWIERQRRMRGGIGAQPRVMKKPGGGIPELHGRPIGKRSAKRFPRRQRRARIPTTGHKRLLKKLSTDLRGGRGCEPGAVGPAVGDQRPGRRDAGGQGD